MFSYRRTLVRRRVIVNLVESDTVFRGIAWAQRGPLLVLRDVEARTNGSQPVAVDGEVIVERRRISYIQVLAGAG